MMEGSSSNSSTARVRVLPGSTLSLSNPPPPPSQPPPRPVHLCKIAVIGNPFSGKSSLVNKFLTRKSAAASAVNINGGGGGDNNSAAAAGANDMTVQWCNASATSNGTFGSALGASLIGPIGSSGGGASEHTATLAEYYKKDISLKRGGGRRSRRNEEQQQQEDHAVNETTTTTTCVRAQVWDINVPIPQPHFNSDNNDNNNHKNDLNNSPDYIKSTSSITTSQQQHSQQINNNNSVTNSLLAPLLPLLKRINGIIIACQCPLPPTKSSSSSLLYSSNASHASHASYNTQSSIRSDSRGEWYWEELDLLEGQIAHWIQFVRRGDGGYSLNGVGVNGAAVNNDGSNNKSRNNHSIQHHNTIIIILTYADIAITEYSPKEWMKLSVKMEEICKKFGIHSWRMGTCVSSSDNNNSSSGGGGKSEYDNAANGDDRNAKEKELNNFISRSNQQQQQQQQQHQYGLFQRMAIQQQRLLEDMEDSVEGTFIDMILLHLDK
ncbi:hypothetical protein ACHAWC_011735 [Mediolabrus comicus]